MGGFAWVTLATNDSYSLGALVLAHSLKRVNTAHQLAILITPGVTEAMRTQLSAVFNVVKEVDVLDSRDAANLALLARPELGITFTKLHCWRLTQFDKCVFLDADTLVLQNCDELFDREELSAAPDVGWPDCFNSGVFVYKPSDETFKAISDFALVHGTFDGGDQGLLNLYFSDWATKDIAKHLPFVYNVVSCVTYSYLPALKQFRDKLKIIHFIGATKPWLQPFDTEAGLSRVSSDTLAQSQSDFIQLWWNIFCTSVHPSLSANMAGLAGALATVKLGSSLSEEHHALQDHLRRQGWEEGHVDYMGRDSFDNIWAKICETLSAGPSPVAASADLPAAAAAETQASATTTPPREVVRVEARRTSVPKAEKALETLFMKPNTMLQPTSEQADPLTPPPFLAQPQFTPAAASAASKTDDAKLAETASLPVKVESESSAIAPKPEFESPAIAPKPESESPIPPKPQPESPAPPTPQPESPACPLPTPEQAPAPTPSQTPASPIEQTPAAPTPAQTPASPIEQTPAIPPPAQTPAVPPPAQTPAVPPPAQDPSAVPPPAQTPAVPPPAQDPAVPPPAQTPAVPPPVQTPAVPPPVQTPATPPPTQTPAAPSTQTPASPPAQTPAPVEGIPAATPLNEPSSVKAPETTPPSVVKSETTPPSQPTLPETPPQSPPQPSETPVHPQPENPKTPVQSQPSTPTVTTATPPLSPPPVPSESAVEKLSVQVDIPQTPPVVDIPPATAASPVVPQESAASAVSPVVPQASAPSDEPPIPPKRKGGRGGGDQGKQGRGGGKGGRGKK